MYTTSIANLQMFFSSIDLHSCGQKDMKAAWKAQSEFRQSLIILVTQKCFSDCDPAKTETIVIRNSVDLISRPTLNHLRRIVRDEVKRDCTHMVS